MAHASLIGANLEGANLEGANLGGTNLEGVDLGVGTWLAAPMATLGACGESVQWLAQIPEGTPLASIWSCLRAPWREWVAEALGVECDLESVRPHIIKLLEKIS